MTIMKPLLFLTLFLVNVGADYCICRDNKTEHTLQAAIDYACLHGAVCASIKPNGTCYQPNNTKSTCDFAANSFYEHKAFLGAKCDLSGAAILVSDPPHNVPHGCHFSAMVPVPSTKPDDFSTTFGQYDSGSVRSVEIRLNLVWCFFVVFVYFCLLQKLYCCKPVSAY